MPRSIDKDPVGHQGLLLVSLDFELGWGVHDIMPMEACRTRLEGTRKVVPEILSLFSEYGVHATWAIVGLLFFDSRRELVASLPPYLPKYTNEVYNPYQRLSQLGAGESADPYHYAASLVELIQKTPHQEIGTHTFSHYYCLENGQDPDAFREDLRAAMRAARRFGLVLRTCIFPRNQVKREYIPIFDELGIVAYRDNPPGWLYAPCQRSRELQLRRALRLCDAYVGLTGHCTYSLADLGQAPPFGMPASRYLRPYSRARRWIEPLRARRIRKAMTYAAQRGRVFHLWTHPEDLGLDNEENLAFLRGVLEHYARLARDYGMRSANLGELAGELQGEQCAARRYSG